MTERLRAIGGNVLVELIDPPETEGRIMLPQSYKPTHVKARVLSVGPGETSPKGVLIPLGVQVGDVVLTTRYSGAKVERNGKRLSFLTRNEIGGIIVED